MASRKRTKPPVVARRKRMTDEEKASAALEVAVLKAKPEWDPTLQPKQTPGQRLRAMQSAYQTTTTYEKSAACSDCLTARETGDVLALCAAHLSAALGF